MKQDTFYVPSKHIYSVPLNSMCSIIRKTPTWPICTAMCGDKQNNGFAQELDIRMMNKSRWTKK